MAKTVAVVNTKGGVGKTTLTAALGVRAMQDGARVGLVDMDPQLSLTQWWQRRGEPDNPIVYRDGGTTHDAIDALLADGCDWVFIDSPPAFLTVVQETIEAADFVLVPMTPSAFDLGASQDVVMLARDAGAAFMCVMNNVGQYEKKIAASVRDLLIQSDVPLATQTIAGRPMHKQGATVGKAAAELANGAAAAAEIDALWIEIKAAATAAVADVKVAANG